MSVPSTQVIVSNTNTNVVEVITAGPQGPTGPMGNLGPTGPGPGSIGPTGPTGSNNASLIAYSPPFSGSIATTVAAKLAQTVSVLDFGADPTGATDSTAAFNAAAAALGNAGGIVNFQGWFLLTNFILPNGVILNGSGISVGQVTSGAYTPTNISSALILNGSITHNDRCAIQNCLLITTDLAPGGAHALPFANGTVAAAAVAAFSGNAVIPALVTTRTDFRLENLLILGFNFAYNGLSAIGLNRPLFRRVYLDCTNGIHVVNVFDIGRAEDCHAWGFTTTNQSFTTNALLLRTGNAFFTGSGSTWMKWQDCFEFGWAIGHRVSACQDVRQITCGADGPATGSNIGFQYDGSMANVYNIGPTATQQGNTGILVNTTTQNNVNDVKILAPVCHGNNSANGYIHIQSGNYAISDGFFSDNSAVGHIKLDSTAGVGSLVSPTFANNGTNQPVFGDAGAISRCNILNDMYQGTFIKQALATWTPVLRFGGASVGITYATQTGNWQLLGRQVVLEFQIILTSKGSSTGVADIVGLPVNPSGAAGVNHAGECNYYLATVGLTGAPSYRATAAGPTIIIYQGSATGVTQCADTNFTNTTIIYGRLVYDAA